MSNVIQNLFGPKKAVTGAQEDATYLVIYHNDKQGTWKICLYQILCRKALGKKKEENVGTPLPWRKNEWVINSQQLSP